MKNEKGGKKGTGPLSPLKICSAEGEELATMRGGTTTMAACLFVCTSVIRSSNQQSEYRSSIFGRQGPFCPP